MKAPKYLQASYYLTIATHSSDSKKQRMMASGLDFEATATPVEDEEEGPVAHGQRLVVLGET